LKINEAEHPTLAASSGCVKSRALRLRLTQLPNELSMVHTSLERLKPGKDGAIVLLLVQWFVRFPYTN
jgi:hypothetical protein